MIMIFRSGLDRSIMVLRFNNGLVFREFGIGGSHMENSAALKYFLIVFKFSFGLLTNEERFEWGIINFYCGVIKI